MHQKLNTFHSYLITTSNGILQENLKMLRNIFDQNQPLKHVIWGTEHKDSQPVGILLLWKSW